MPSAMTGELVNSVTAAVMSTAVSVTQVVLALFMSLPFMNGASLYYNVFLQCACFLQSCCCLPQPCVQSWLHRRLQKNNKDVSYES
jgi:hypothetical protein